MDKLDKIFSTDIPDVFYDCQKQFGVKWEDVIITYYPHIHSSVRPNQIKTIHELTHIQQQEKYGVKDWWARYLQDKDFRLSQEVGAYRNEIAYIKEIVKDRNLCFKLIRDIYKALSGEMYGSMVDYEEARKLLS